MSPRSILVKRCSVLPVEVVVRGYLTGSAWRDYRAGNAGLRDRASRGDEDEPEVRPAARHAFDQGGAGSARRAHLPRRNRLERAGAEDLWEQVEATALALFERGTAIAAGRGLILVDTKYEFGLDRRRADAGGRDPYSRTPAASGMPIPTRSCSPPGKSSGSTRNTCAVADGPRLYGRRGAPPIPDDVRLETAWRYIQAFSPSPERIFPRRTDAEAERNLLESVMKKTASGSGSDR